MMPTLSTPNKKIIAAALLVGVTGYGLGYYFGRGHVPVQTGVPQAQENLPSGPVVGVEDYYICPMHPEIIAHEPGECPICGMKLVKKRGGGGAGHHHDGYPAVLVSPAVVYNLGIRTTQARRGELKQRIETIGKITRVDQSAKRIITPPIDGRLVYLVDKYEGDEVAQGELLFSVSSPELIELERRFQETLQREDRNTAGVLAAELQRNGLSPEQISRLRQGVKPDVPVEVHALEPGYIFDRRGKPGEPVGAGFTVFSIGGDYRVVDVTAEIFERQWNWIEAGQSATMTVRGLPGVNFEGQVVRVEPPVGYTTRSLEVLLKFKTNNQGLSQSMFAHVVIRGKSRRHVLLVPGEAVIRTGSGDRVVVQQKDGRYRPVSVVAGEEAGGLTEIRSGLKAGVTVVVSGQFLIDSESSLRAEMRRMSAPGEPRPSS